MEGVDWCLMAVTCITVKEDLYTDLEETISETCRVLLESANHGEVCVPSADTNKLLVQISLLTRFMEMTRCCRQVQAWKRSVTCNTDIVQTLVRLLGHPKQLVCYSSCKLLGAILIQDVDINEKLKNLIDESIAKTPYPEDFKDTDASKHSRLLMTFDLLRSLLKRADSALEDFTDVLPSCTCEEMQTLHNVHRTAQIVEAVMSLNFMTDIFRSLLSKRKPFPISKDIPCECLQWLRALPSCELDVLFTSYLKLEKSVIKRSQTEFSDSQKGIISFLVDVLAIFSCSRISLKLSTDILTNFMQTRIRTYKDDDSDSVHFLILTAHHLCELCTDGWLLALPYHEGHVGFGGIVFTDNANFKQQIGDRPLLQKLTKMILVAAVILTGETQTEPIAHLKSVTSSIYHLRKFVISKIAAGLPVESDHDDWLHDLFSDDDDDQMVSVMFVTLKIYINFKKCNRKEIIKCEMIRDDHPLRMPSPHPMFWNYLKMMDFDHSVLLDLLMSSETEFLECFTCYLHLMKAEWDTCRVIFRELYQSGITAEKVFEETSRNFDQSEHLKENIPHVHEKVSNLNGCERQPKEENSPHGEQTPELWKGGKSSVKIASGHLPISRNPLPKESQGCSSSIGRPPKRIKTCHGPSIDPGINPMCPASSNSSILCCGNVSVDGSDLGASSQILDCSASTKSHSEDDEICQVNGGIKEQAPDKEDDGEVDVNLGLDEIFSVLIRLRLSLERLHSRNMFPYSVTPLVKLLEELEACYEG